MSQQGREEVVLGAGHRGAVGRRLKWAGVCAWVLMTLTATAVCAQQWGRRERYVNITSSKVERLSNAVRVILEADGVLELEIDPSQFWYRDEETGWWTEGDLTRISFDLLNARSQVGRYVDISMYPASHLALSVPTGAQQGVGLAVDLVLYAPARGGRLQLWGGIQDWAQWHSGHRRVDIYLSTDQRKLIITVHTDRHYEEGEEAAPPPPTHQSLVIEPVGQGLRLQSVNAPLNEVLDRLAELSGRSVVLGAGVNRRLTANLPPMPPEALLRVICRATCLSLVERDGGYFVSEGTVSDVGTYLGEQARRIGLRCLPVDAALLLLPTAVLSHVRSDTEGNAIVAYGPPVLLDKIEADLRVLDHPGLLVRLRAAVVTVRDQRRAARMLSTLLAGGNTSVALQTTEGTVRVGVVGTPLDHVLARLKALEERGAVRIEARPEVSVLSGRRARLFVGSQQYYRFLRRRWWGAQLVLRKVDVGVTLTAEPWGGCDEITTVPFEVSSDSIIGRDPQGLPFVSRQSATGCLRVTKRETIVFGGLRLREQEQEGGAVHPLQEAPVIGGLLASRDSQGRTNEVIVCLAAVGVQRPAPVSSAPVEFRRRG